MLDSDTAGDQAARKDVLVHTLGNKGILRTKDYTPSIPKAEIEDLLRDTLPLIAGVNLGIDKVGEAASNPDQPLVDMPSKSRKDFSKYRLAKAFLRWSRDHDASELSHDERKA